MPTATTVASAGGGGLLECEFAEDTATDNETDDAAAADSAVAARTVPASYGAEDHTNQAWGT